jgi:hypothetical protein
MKITQPASKPDIETLHLAYRRSTDEACAYEKASIK